MLKKLLAVLATAALVAGIWFYLANEPVYQDLFDGPIDGWSHYGKDSSDPRFSPLNQINRQNVADLKVAWEYHAEENSPWSVSSEA